MRQANRVCTLLEAIEDRGVETKRALLAGAHVVHCITSQYNATHSNSTLGLHRRGIASPFDGVVGCPLEPDDFADQVDIAAMGNQERIQGADEKAEPVA